MPAHCAQFVVRRPPRSAPLCIPELPLLSFTQYSWGQERHGSAEQRDDRMSSARALPWAAPPAGSHQAGPEVRPQAQESGCGDPRRRASIRRTAACRAPMPVHCAWSPGGVPQNDFICVLSGAPSAQCGLLAPDAVAHGGLDDISHPVNASFGVSRPGKRAARCKARAADETSVQGAQPRLTV